MLMFHPRPPRNLARTFSLATLLTFSALSAQAQSLSINGTTSASVTACDSGSLNFSGLYSVSYYGSWTYTWTLYRNGSAIKQTKQAISCSNNGFPCQLPSFIYQTSALGMAGTYQLQLTAQQWGLTGFQGSSNQVSVGVSSSGPTPILKINGNSNTVVDVCAVGPIILDGSANTCASDFFVSVQLSDANWNRYNYEAMRWLTPQDYSTYGAISSFNAKKFAEDQWFSFVPGQYYRIKLATGNPWKEVTKLARIQPSVAEFTLNGSTEANQPIQVPANGPIVINGTLSSCASGYFVSIQLSDASWNRYGFEAMRWLTPQDFANYGPIHAFNVKKFAEDQWFSFVPGQYYRVKLAVGSPWSESSKLIQITP
jgi:hypothetical protein